MTKTMKPKTTTTKPPRREWSWDEIILTINAWHHIQHIQRTQGNRKLAAAIIDTLADELGITLRQARNAVQAVGNQRNNSDALAILMGRHKCPVGLRDPEVAYAEAQKVRKRLGRLP
jgi:hypothetical protein